MSSKLNPIESNQSSIAVSMYNVYVPFEENWDADWLPYNCTIVEDEIFFKDGKYYYEGDEPANSVEGERNVCNIMEVGQ